MLDPQVLQNLIEGELAQVSDARVLDHIAKLRIVPLRFAGRWIFTRSARFHPCWGLLRDRYGGIAYCASGFGPSHPWGLMRIEDGYPMGDDTSWLPTLLDAYFSYFGDELPIWRVLMRQPGERPRFITAEDSWDETWKRVLERRASDPVGRYDCDHAVAYASPFRTEDETALT